MSKRSQVVLASVLMVVGLGAIAGKIFLPPLNACGVNDFCGATANFDFTKLFLWGGAILLVVSAFLYIRASAE